MPEKYDFISQGHQGDIGLAGLAGDIGNDGDDGPDGDPGDIVRQHLNSTFIEQRFNSISQSHFYFRVCKALKGSQEMLVVLVNR